MVIAPAKPSLPATLGWACYLACSWTWVIGMFLPVLLVRDYGVWGFVAFALPNVLGAAAMGFVVSSPEHSRAITTRHATAVACFSAITIAFQVVFLFSIGTMFFASERLTYVYAAGALVAAAIAGLLRGVGAALIWIASLVILALAWNGNGLTLPRSEAPPTDLLLLAPVCVFGFALCPYLDGTFHRARVHLGARAPLAFALGFGVLFFAMILGTLTYAEPVALLLQNPELAVMLPGVLIIGCHIALQAAYTSLLHIPVLASAKPSRLPVAVFFVALIVGAAISAFCWYHTPWGITFGELTYRLFMSFYGLVFPAYAWLCMIPTRDGHAGVAGPQGRRKLGVLILAITAATPCYWLGFIMRDEFWLVPGLVVVLISRLLVRGRLYPAQP